MLTHTTIQTTPLRCSSSLSFSLPYDSKYLTSLIRNLKDDIQTLSKGSYLLRGFSPKIHFIPKYSFQTLLVYRTHPHELPKLHEHKFTSQPTSRNVLTVNKLTMLFTGVQNLRSNSFQLGGHDKTQLAKQMTMTQEAFHTLISHLSLQDKAPPNIRRTSVEEELSIDQSIRCSFFWSSYKTKMFVNKLGSLWGFQIQE